MCRNCIVIPVGVCACVIERWPSTSLRVSGLICLEWGQRICVTLGKKAEWSAARLCNALTRTSMESAASVFRKMQFDRSTGAHTWELGAKPRSACNIPFGMGLFL